MCDRLESHVLEWEMHKNRWKKEDATQNFSFRPARFPLLSKKGREREAVMKAMKPGREKEAPTKWPHRAH